MEDQLPAWRRPAAVTLPVRLDPTGRRGPTRSAARGGRWRRTSHGFYVPTAVDSTLPEQRVAEAVPLLIPGGVVTGWGALRMWGAGFLDGRSSDGVTLLPVTLTQGRHAPVGSTSPGIRHRHDHVGSWVDVAGVRLHSASRAVVDEMRLAPDLEHAVVAADAVRAASLATCEEVEETLAALRGWQGIALARTAWSLSSDAVKSPPETRLRLLCRAAGLPPTLVNVAVFARGGRLLGCPDLLDAEAGLVVEYDSADHRTVAHQRSDHLRDEVFRAHRLEPLRVTSLDLLRPVALTRRLLDVRSRCAFLEPHERPWTLTAPPGWRPPGF